VLLDESAMNLVATRIRPRHFYQPRHAAIFAAMAKLSEEGCPSDIITVGDALEQMPTPTGDGSMLNLVGGRSYLAGLEQTVPTAANILHYADIVFEKWQRRRAIQAGGEIAGLAYDETVETAVVMDKMQEVVFGVAMGNLKTDFADMTALTAEASQRMYAGTVPGIHTGFAGLDFLLDGGVKEEQLIIVAARPGVGKTSLGLNFGLAAARAGLPVNVFSLEMSSAQLTDRLISQTCGLPTKRFRNAALLKPEEIDRVQGAMDSLRGLPFYIDDDPALDELSLLSKGRRAKAKYDTQLILVDYLQLMSGKGMNREQEVTHISHSMKRMARELKVPVVCMAQLNRDAEKRANKRPTLADLRESGSIENDADVVIFIYREDYHDQEAPAGEAELIVGKNRQGATGTVKVRWRPELTQFVDMTTSEFAGTEAFA
jgi:replicative DNA helicase